MYDFLYRHRRYFWLLALMSGPVTGGIGGAILDSHRHHGLSFLVFMLFAVLYPLGVFLTMITIEGE